MESEEASTSSSGGDGGEELPQCFNVRYLGFRAADGLWGIKHTRQPVDEMVAAVKTSNCKSNLHLIKFAVTHEGCKLESVFNDKIETRFFPIESISYGVQDLVYTRVFAMIVVKEIPDRSNESVFECHAFVCDSRQSARKLTYSLATAFHRYSRQLRAAAARPAPPQRRKLFAIDLRTPEEIARQTKYQDSEA